MLHTETFGFLGVTQGTQAKQDSFIKETTEKYQEIQAFQCTVPLISFSFHSKQETNV